MWRLGRRQTPLKGSTWPTVYYTHGEIVSLRGLKDNTLVMSSLTILISSVITSNAHLLRSIPPRAELVQSSSSYILIMSVIGLGRFCQTGFLVSADSFLSLNIGTSEGGGTTTSLSGPHVPCESVIARADRQRPGHLMSAVHDARPEHHF